MAVEGFMEYTRTHTHTHSEPLLWEYVATCSIDFLVFLSTVLVLITDSVIANLLMSAS